MHDKSTYGKVEASIFSFLTSVIYVINGHRHAPAALPPGKKHSVSAK